MKAVERIIDAIFSAIPQPRPSIDRLQSAKIVAHRGVTTTGAQENSLEAIELCIKHQLWAVEFDLHFTKDNVPVINHDADLGRHFLRPELLIHQMEFSKLRSLFPTFPALADVLQMVQGQLHLMIEIKCPLSPQQNQILAEHLQSLVPEKDFHFLALSPEILDSLSFAPQTAKVIVCEINSRAMSEAAFSKNYGGIAGHYCLLNKNYLKRHHERGQKVGTGFIANQNTLFRELKRGVDWLFTDRPLELKAIIDQATKSP